MKHFRSLFVSFSVLVFVGAHIWLLVCCGVAGVEQIGRFEVVVPSPCMHVSVAEKQWNLDASVPLLRSVCILAKSGSISGAKCDIWRSFL